MEYATLSPKEIIETQRRLHKRIVKRFPSSDLSQLAEGLLAIAEKAARRAKRILRPHLLLRFAVGILLLGAAAFGVRIAMSVQLKADLRDVMNLVQFTEATIGASVFVGAAVFFLISLEMRLKRRRAFAAIHELRALAHIVDMHQVAKDPEGLIQRGPSVAEPREQTTKTLFDLNRYLNYCNELLAITSKIAALYVQRFPDGPTVSAVDQVESLCTGLSNKIWQKIMILEEILDDQGHAHRPAGHLGRWRSREQQEGANHVGVPDRLRSSVAGS